MIYDAIFLYAHALHKTLKANRDEYDGALVAKNMFDIKFQGMDHAIVENAVQ